MQFCPDIRTFVRMPTSIPLTENQRRVLDCIERYFAQHGCAPTLREIAETLGFARHSSAQDYVEALVRKGALERLPRHRGLRLAARGGRARSASAHALSAHSLPLIGRVAAGSPILAQGNVEQQIGIDASLFRPAADYLLRVVGSSMRDAGILDGDLIAVHRTVEAAQGRIVVARLDDEVTVKRLDSRDGRVRLLPENPDFAPIEVDPRRHEFAIEGVYVGVIRQG